MKQALDQLLKGCVDYAGLFPPADLNLREAGEIFVTDQTSCYGTWLRHFVLPANRIGEFNDLRNSLRKDARWTLSVLVGSGATLYDWQASIDDAVANFEKNRGNTADAIRVLEVALPRAMADDAASFTQAIDALDQQLASTRLVDCDLFFETTSSDHRQTLAKVLRARQRGNSRVGLKLRTGGLEATQFPSSGQLADCIRLCHSLDMPWKATAGLHHPLPIDCQRTGATMHGFLNLLFAVVLLEGKLLPEEKIEDLLLDRNPNHFHFSENGLGWMGVRADLDQIRRGRQRFLSYGSCSFTEPIEDLTHLGFLNR